MSNEKCGVCGNILQAHESPDKPCTPCGETFSYATSTELFEALGRPKLEAEKMERELNAILRRKTMTLKHLREIIELWAAYKNDMRPETRNDFLRHFDKHMQALPAALDLIEEMALALECCSSATGYGEHDYVDETKRRNALEKHQKFTRGEY